MNAITKGAAPAMVLRPQSFGELVQFAQMAAKSQMVPRDFQGKPENIMLAVQMGSELGLAPMQSLQNIAIVNGRPSVWGDALPGLCKQSGVCDDIEEWFDGEGDHLTAWCKAKRAGKQPVVQSFSVEDAKKAGLWGKTGPWQQYPRRMLQMRARGFALRDAFPDVLRGLISAEEARDIPQDTFTGPTINATPEPAADAPVERKGPTVREFLDDLEQRLIAACDGPTPERDVDDILSGADVKKAEDTLTNGAAARLRQIMDTAIAQVAARQEAAE